MTPLQVGPANPLIALPLGILSGAIDCWLELCANGTRHTPESFLIYLGAILRASRMDVVGHRAGRIDLIRFRRADPEWWDIGLLAYDDVIIAPATNRPGLPTFDVSRLYLGPASSREFNVVPRLDLERLSVAVAYRLDICAPGTGTCRLDPETSGLYSAVLSVLRNSPFDRAAAEREGHKYRFRVIDLICAPETEASIAALAALVHQRPLLMFLPGWCGGIMLHSLSRLGNRRMIQRILHIADQPSIRRRLEREPIEMLAWQNCDGCTPLHMASLFGQQHVVADLMLRGSNPMAQNRYGYPALMDAAATGRS